MYRYEKKLEKAKKKGIRFEEFELEYIEIARTHGLGVLEMYGATLIKAMTEAKNQKKRERIRQLLWICSEISESFDDDMCMLVDVIIKRHKEQTTAGK